MTTKIKKWGNSLALRIPKLYVKEINLKEGTDVELKVEENKIIISSRKKKRKTRKKYTLEELVSRITPENRHGEISVGSRVGKELI